MSRTIRSYGGAPPSLPRTLTFASDWARLEEQFPDAGFPWQFFGNGPTSYYDQPSGAQVTQNEEQQYYVKQSELLGVSAAQEWDNGRPWNVDSNGHLVLRAIRTPPAYEDIAYVSINSYRVTAVSGRNITVTGTNYFDRASGTNKTGVNEYEMGLFTGRPCQIRQGNDRYNIESVNGSTSVTIRVDRDVSGIAVNSLVQLNRPTEFISGMRSSRRAFAQKMGSFECRLRFPAGRGGFPAAWLWPNEHQWYSGDPATQLIFSTADRSTEVDVAEILGHAPDILYFNLHSPQPTIVPTMREFVTARGLTPFYPDAPGWTGGASQQHQVLIEPGSPDYINGATDWITVRFDWYLDNTGAYFVKKDNWSDFRKVASAHMTPHADNGVLDEHCWFLNNAVKGSFNVNQEYNDRNYPRFVSAEPDIYDFKIDYVRTYQWDGGIGGGSGLPDQSGAMIYTTGGGLVQNGVITDPGTPGGGNTGTTELRPKRNPDVIQQPSVVAAGTYKTLVQEIPEGADVDDYTFAWTVGPGATISGPSDQQTVTILIDPDATGDTSATCTRTP